MQTSVNRAWGSLAIFCLLTAGALPAHADEVVTDGLILRLDAAQRIKTGGARSPVWQDLARQPDRVAGSATLHNFSFDERTGWVGYCNDASYALLPMNHKEQMTAAVHPHQAHLDVYTRVPRLLVSDSRQWKAVEPARKGIQYMLELPAGGSALLIWEGIK